MNDKNTPTDANTPDNPLLTAYALGELEPGSDDYAQVETLIAKDADAAAFVEQTRALGEQLSSRYAAAQDLSGGLSGEQQDELTAAIDANAADGSGSESEDGTSNSGPVVGSIKPRPGRRLDGKPMFSRTALLAAGLAIAAGATIATLTLLKPEPNPIVENQDAEPVKGLAQVHAALAKPVAVDFDNAPLKDVLTFLQKETGVQVKVDWAALAPRGVTADTRITVKADEPQPAREVLNYVLQLSHPTAHPDPAQWAASDDGIAIAPTSTLVQLRLDATSELLNSRRFSSAPLDPRMLEAGKAEVWETGLYKQILSQRKQAGSKLLAEATGVLNVADDALKDRDYAAAAGQSMYAYRLLLSGSSLVDRAELSKSAQRIDKLRRGAYLGQLYMDDPALAADVDKALRADKSAEAYTQAMAEAAKAQEAKDYDRAMTQAIKARAVLLATGPKDDAETFYKQIQTNTELQRNVFSQRFSAVAEQLNKERKSWQTAKSKAMTDLERQHAQKMIEHVQAALNHQYRYNFPEALAQIDAGLKADPGNTALTELKQTVTNFSVVAKHTKLQRQRDLVAGDVSLATATLDWGVSKDKYNDGESDQFASKSESFEKSRKLAELKRDIDGLKLNLGERSAGNYPGGPTDSLGLVDAKPGQSFGPVAGKGAVRWQNSNSKVPVGRPASLGKELKKKSGNAPYPAVSTPPAPQREADFSGEATTHYYFRSVHDLPDYDERSDGRRGNHHAGFIAEQPLAEKTRTVALKEQLEGLEKKAKEGQALTESEREHREALAAHLKHTDKTEGLEQDRIAAIKDLNDLEARFAEQTIEAMQFDPQMDRDAYAVVNDNPFYTPTDPGRNMSTFSVDVDTAAYSLVRRQLMQQNRLPVPGAVRIEEMINYFDYDYQAPRVDGRALEDGVVTQASLEKYEKNNKDFAPFSTDVQVTDCPWQPGHRLVRVGIKGMEVALDKRPPAHLTFLMDVSGSMGSANKLPLAKKAMLMLLDKLNADDRITIVVYAGRTARIIENVAASDKQKIQQALNNLKSGGGTAGAAGVQLAYESAQKHYIDGGVNRVILCTDGDFNIGLRGDALVNFVKEKANPKADADGKRRGVYLSVMGFGMGNLNDRMMEPMTNAGNGNYAYIDTLEEAQKVMYDQAGAMLVTIAKDVKVQVHFDPQQVQSYRLIGYENRVLANEDFDNDKVDAGDIGAGHSVTAIYEVKLFDDDFLNDDEAWRVVQLMIQKLDKAIASNTSLMQTASLTGGQRTKLAASTRLLAQERSLAASALNRVNPKAAAKVNAALAANTPRPVPKPAIKVPAPPAADGDAKPKDAEAKEAKAPPKPAIKPEKFDDGAMLAIRLRYKPVDAPAEDGTSRLIKTRVFPKDTVQFEQADEATRFAAAVAAYGMVLRSSPHAGNADLPWVIQTAEGASQYDPDQYRKQFIDLVKKTQDKMPKKPAPNNNAAPPAPVR